MFGLLSLFFVRGKKCVGVFVVVVAWLGKEDDKRCLMEEEKDGNGWLGGFAIVIDGGEGRCMQCVQMHCTILFYFL